MKRQKQTATVVLCTAPTLAEARRLSTALLGSRLAACVSLIPNVQSAYWWKGKVEKSREILLVIKTVGSRMAALTRRIKALHTYTVPEVIALRVTSGNPDYLAWIQGAIEMKKKKGA